MIKVGDKAPDFCLKGVDAAGQEGEFCLSDLMKHKKQIILYFYPKDNTPGCTQEACDFRDNLNRLTVKAVVIGVSRDSLASHLKFREKQGLNFPLLSDPDHKVLELYGAWGFKPLTIIYPNILTYRHEAKRMGKATGDIVQVGVADVEARTAAYPGRAVADRDNNSAYGSYLD